MCMMFFHLLLFNSILLTNALNTKNIHSQCLTTPSLIDNKEFQSLNYTVFNDLSVLIYEDNELTFKHTNIPKDMNNYDIDLCDSKDGNCKFGEFDIRIKKDGLTSKELKRLEKTIHQEYLMKGTKSFFELPFNGKYCLIYYIHGDSDIRPPLEILEYHGSNSNGGDQDNNIITRIIALVLETILIYIILKQVKNSNQVELMNFIPFIFMINLLTIEILKNILNILFQSSRLLSYLQIITSLLRNVCIYHFVGLNKAVLSPLNWHKRLVKHRIFIGLELFKVLLKLAIIFKLNLWFSYTVLTKFTSVLLIVLFYIRSQMMEWLIHKQYKSYSIRFRYTRIFIAPAMIIYQIVGKTMMVFMGSLYKDDRFMILFLVILMYYIWRGVLKKQDEISEEEEVATPEVSLIVEGDDDEEENDDDEKKEIK